MLQANTVRYKCRDIIPIPVRRSLNRGYKWVDPHYYTLPPVDTTSLPSVDYVNELTVKDVLETTSYLKLLRRLCSLRDPEITARILYRMDCEMEALAILPSSSGRRVYEGPIERDSLEKWLEVWDKNGLHVIRQTTIAILRGSLNDEYEVELPQRAKYFGKKDTEIVIPVVWDDKGIHRQYAYRRRMVEHAELFGHAKVLSDSQ